MKLTEEDKQAYRNFMAEIENVLFYSNAAWISKHGAPMLADSAVSARTGFRYPKCVDRIEKELEMLEQLTEEEEKELEKSIPHEMPKHFQKIPKEMRDLMDTVVQNMLSLKGHYQKDTIWLASAENEVIKLERLQNASKKGFHHLDFGEFWGQVDQKRQRRILLEFRNA